MATGRARRTIGGLVAAATLATTLAFGAATGAEAESPGGLTAVSLTPTSSSGALTKAQATAPGAVGGVAPNAVGDVTITSDGCTPDPVDFGSDTSCSYSIQNQTSTASTVDLSATGDSELTVTGATQGAVVAGGTATAEDVVLPPRTSSGMSVEPGSTFAGYYAMSQIPINPQTIGDDQLLNYTVQPFRWNGATYTSIGISSNGYAVVGGGDTTKDQSLTPQDLPSTTRPNNVLAPFWTDLTPTGGALRVATVANTAQPPCERAYWFVAEWEMYEYGTATMRKAQLWIQADDPECATDPVPPETVYFTYDFTTMTAAPARAFRIGAENSTGTSGAMRPAGQLPTDHYVVKSTGSVTPAPVVNWKVTGRGTGVGTGTIAATAASDLIPGSSTVFSDVTVNGFPAPGISDDPDDLTVTTGEQAVFQAAGDAGSTVTWEVSTDDGASWDPVPGATATTLAFTAAMSHDGNQYRAVFTNASGTASATSGEATLSVEQIGTTTSLVATPASPGYGDAVSFTATVAPSGATGSVQFVVDGDPLGSPVALSGGTATSSSISSLAPGGHEVTASYFGDTDHAASDATETVTVGLIPTSTTVSNDPLGPTVGETVTLTANVTPTTATGSVQFVLDGELLGSPVTLVNGVATSPASPPLSLGLHVPMAFYYGDATHSTSNAGSDQSFQVTPKSTSFSALGSTPSPQLRRGTVAYTATLSPAPTGGTVQFTLDGNPIGSPVAVVNGTATTPTAAVTASAGSHTLGATYSGDATYGALTDSTTITVDKIPSTVTPPQNWNQGFQPEIARFLFRVGPGTPDGTFQLVLEGIDAPAPRTIQVEDGFADFEVFFPQAGGQYIVRLTYQGDDDLLPAAELFREFTIEDEATTFVRQAYGLTLDRAPDPGGLAHWSARLRAGTTTPTGVVDALASSAEGRRTVIRRAYVDILGRQPDAAGQAYWLRQGSVERSPEALRSALLASDEGFRRAGGNSLGYSMRLYDHYLDRTAGASELSFWTTRLGSKPTRWDRQKAALTVGRSNEGTRSAVRTALSTACGSTTATDDQKAALGGQWLTHRHPARLAGAAAALVCYPDFSTPI